jgi:diadenosine tetraphosphatase ApaH/serine/threonine PP2A family protein phosphatase
MIALISDIHANLPALEAVLADIDAHAPSGQQPRIWCLGDTVGYGASVSACIDIVQASCEVVLAGNHDLAAVGDARIEAARAHVPGMFEGTPGAGIEHARRTLAGDEQRRSWLAALAPQQILDNLDLAHGSTRDPIWEYVRTPETALPQLQSQQRELAAVGHTHMPLLWELPAGATEAVGGLMPAGSSLVLEPGTRRVFNPGSVGQPRDRDPRAAWASLIEGTLTFHRVEYDIERARAAIIAAGLPTEAGERLELGW